MSDETIAVKKESNRLLDSNEYHTVTKKESLVLNLITLALIIFLLIVSTVSGYFFQQGPGSFGIFLVTFIVSTFFAVGYVHSRYYDHLRIKHGVEYIFAP